MISLYLFIYIYTQYLSRFVELDSIVLVQTVELVTFSTKQSTDEGCKVLVEVIDIIGMSVVVLVDSAAAVDFDVVLLEIEFVVFITIGASSIGDVSSVLDSVYNKTLSIYRYLEIYQLTT